MHSPNEIEMAEVHNAGTTPINLGGLRWAEGTGGNFPEISLAAGASIVFSTAPTTASTVFNNQPVYLLTAGLSSSNDILVIRNSLNQTIDSVAYYVGTNGWPVAPNGVYGYSFELNSIANDNNVGSNWFVPQNPIIPQPTNGVVRATPGIYPTPAFTPTSANVSFVGSRVTVNENGTTTVNIIANLQGGGSLPSSVDIALLPIGTANNNQDFTLPNSLKFEWPANANNVNDTIAITINNDVLPEPTEYLMFRFVNPINIILPVSSANHFTVLIQDDDFQNLTPSNSIQLNHIASFSNGTAGSNSAEIVAHDPVSQRLFIVNSIGGKLDIVNFNNPASASIIKSISVTPY
ncbi:MAG: choice-of-anchor I domain-containing protein, partial [Dolichospermum sp.]